MSTRMVFKQYKFDLPGKDGRVIPENCNCITLGYQLFLGLICRIFEALERVLAIVEGGRLGNEAS